ncbi:hypothetical protein KFK09_028352 [Dendrobium nobile]|uniref:RNase H type-1 domain-containing protein n=1 Tax=Dendrobium nobile TaxID=94219 RepID=A0A8T3A298_DENNO|nr:hypothetical protein KFK09_028352 [Dendrobium nobile]
MEVVREQDVCFVRLLETKMSHIGRKEIDYLIGNNWDFVHVPAVGLSGGMLVLWDKRIVSFVVRNTSSQVILGDLLIPTMGMWKIATVYGSRCCNEREELWRQLEEDLKDPIPAIIGGDFNCILSKEEKRGGKRFLFSKGPREMKQFMLNSNFHDRISTAMTRHLARVASDHSPIAIKLDGKIKVKRNNIKFEDTWRSYPAARSIVFHSWKKNDFGDHSEILQRKNCRTMKALFFWSRSKCKNLKTLKDDLKKEIIELQNKEVDGSGWTNEDLILLRSKVHELSVTLNQLATWWNQRAKARWQEEGDNNWKIFHNFASARRNGNRVVQIRDVNNIVHVEEEEIEKRLSQRVVDELCLEFTVAELQTSVFQQGNNKAPGMDGATGYTIKKTVTRFLGYKTVKEMNYLGIKFSLRRLKMADFQDLLSNAMEKLNAWGKKTLSLGVIKHKYGEELRRGSQKKCTSNAWKILSDGGRQLQNITRWAVGNGNNINVLNDVWVLDMSINKWPTLVDCVALEGMYIVTGMEDRRELLWMMSGKSISAMSFEYTLKCNYNFEYEDYFTWLFKLKLNKEVEIFWWRLGKSAIPTYVFLHYRRLGLDKNYIQGWGIGIPVFQNINSCLEELRRLSNRQPGIVRIYCIVVYLSWRNRNCVKHGKSALPSSVTASNALALASIKSSPYLSNRGTNLLWESHESWCPPSKDWIKINVDASLFRSHCAGVGGIFRDHKGRFILAFGEKRIHWDINKLEMEAVLSVKYYIRSLILEYKGVIFESDNLNVIRSIQTLFKKNNQIVDRRPLEEILFFNDFHKVAFNHVH